MSTTHDPYPTRRPPAARLPEMIPRRGRAVRGGAHDVAAATGIEDAATRFEADGFLSLPGFFSEAEAAPWCEEASRLQNASIDTQPPEAFFEAGSTALRSLFDVPKRSRVFDSLTRHPRLLRLVGALLGETAYLHQTRLNYKPAYAGTGFFWHSDFETWHAEDGMPDMRAVSVSIALCENNEFNGSLMLIPGSHLSFVPCIGTTPDDHYRTSLVVQQIGTPPLEHLNTLMGQGGLTMPTGPAGSVVVFDCNTLHGSHENLSSRPRVNAFFVYNACSNALRAPYAAARPRPTFIAARPNDQPARDPVTEALAS